MGYSHYYTPSKTSTAAQIKAMIEFVNKGIKLFGVDQIAGWAGEIGTKPKVTKKAISFNGVEEDSHETFLISIKSGEMAFCKTNRKPYDSLVVACLIFAEKNNIIEKWSSDGGDEDHQSGKLLFEKVLNE